ncbi:MAG: oxidase [Acidobacteria bacterium]|nr:MAG: oxidase [Acidobacteriota bacterium]
MSDSSERRIHSRSDLGGSANDHVVSPAVYVTVFAALVLLTGLTVFASTVNLGMWNTPVAVVIAVVKAALVVLFFMHVKYSSRLVWLALGGGMLWLLLIIAGAAADYLSRGWVGTPGS